ncbi:hypothetical protein SLEP1_g35572 [Rubroshorea leprosula]|uniref:C2H2-type domain-containing protein n=1 Tax=Rubroshorea leprosula TaxID=152421 RepID=A0AAV5KNL8_9ROSI|nr:hypothetical protein SLEP1_g35572 [Rubroshorea leprosula]
MQTLEEFVGSNDQTLITKGKRTKRQRSVSPFGLANRTSSSSSGCDGRERASAEDYNSISSPTTSAGEIYESTTEEDEDLANCLIMLARGHGAQRIKENRVTNMQGRLSSRKFSELATAETNKGAVGFYVYECKTCNRSFPSFQALGGHRASHKKPKTTVEEKKSPVSPPPQKDDSEEGRFNRNSPFLALQVNDNNKAKIHGCSICGSEFASGQALGGHMRRHRAAAAASAAAAAANQSTPSTDTSTTVDSNNGTDDVKPRNILQLDLNLPAPEEDLRDTKFQFGSSQQTLVFSTPALVDCHY